MTKINLVDEEKQNNKIINKCKHRVIKKSKKIDK